MDNTNNLPVQFETPDLDSDPRRRVFFSYYFAKDNPKTFMNIFESGIAANFLPYEASKIQHSSWYLHNMGNARRDKIFENSENFLLSLTELDTVGENGSHNAALLGVKLKGVLAALEGLGKDYYSKRKEENKTNININISKVLDEIGGRLPNESHNNIIDITPDE